MGARYSKYRSSGVVRNIATSQQRNTIADLSDADLQRLWNAYDVHHKGYLTPNDLSRLMSDIGHRTGIRDYERHLTSFQPIETTQAFQTLDTDHDNMISYGEFMRNFREFQWLLLQEYSAFGNTGVMSSGVTTGYAAAPIVTSGMNTQGQQTVVVELQSQRPPQTVIEVHERPMAAPMPIVEVISAPHPPAPRVEILEKTVQAPPKVVHVETTQPLASMPMVHTETAPSMIGASQFGTTAAGQPVLGTYASQYGSQFGGTQYGSTLPASGVGSTMPMTSGTQYGSTLPASGVGSTMDQNRLLNPIGKIENTAGAALQNAGAGLMNTGTSSRGAAVTHPRQF